MNSGNYLRKNKWILGLYILLGIIGLLLVLDIFLQISPTGLVLFNINPNYVEGETLRGLIELNFNGGELIPQNSLVYVDLNEQKKVFNLSDLIKEEKISGNFYANDLYLNGNGEGYGLIGKNINYPTIDFEIKVTKSSEDIAEGTENSNSDENGSSEVEEQTPSQPEVPSTAETPTEIIIPSETEIPADSANSPQSDSSIDNSVTSESQTDDSETSDSPPGPPSSDEISAITGNAIEGDKIIISGSASKDEPFSYNLEEGWTAELVSGSVRVNSESIDDSNLDFKVDNNVIEITTAYPKEITGFGEEFLTSEIKNIQINIKDLDLEAENGTLKVKLVYNDNIITSAEKEIVTIPSDEPILELNASETNITLDFIKNIPDMRIRAGNSSSIDLKEYFENADEYGFNVENISGNIEDGILTITHDAGFRGARRAQILAYRENKSQVKESNSFNILVSSGAVNIETSRGNIKVGEPVKWTQNISLETNEGVVLDLPIQAENIVVNKVGEVTGELEEINAEIKKLDANGREISDSENFISGNVIAEVKVRKKVSVFGLMFQKIMRITGFAVEDLTSNEVINSGSTEVSISDNSKNYIIEYTTSAPIANESETNYGKQVVISAPSELNYSDVLSFATISEIYKVGEENKIKIYWVENKSYVNFDAYDLDGNNLIDYVEWITPHLSEQTFNIIYITKAEHLDADRNFISDIYDSVKSQDGILSEAIANGDYVRVRFEKNLTNKNDVTIYARSIDSNPASVEVYAKDSNEKIATISDITSENTYKTLLTNMGEELSYNDFDLKIIGSENGGIEFDYIVDPITDICLGGMIGGGNITDPCQIYNWTNLNDSKLDLDAYYVLMTNLSSSSSDYIGLGDNWNPIGTDSDSFTGNFNGGNNTISNLIINLPSTNYVGLFGYATGTLSDIIISNANITGSSYVGGLVGWQSYGEITNANVSGIIVGSNYVGGLVGEFTSINTEFISNSYFVGNVSGSSSVGGLVGLQSGGIVNYSYASGNVDATGDNAGGFVGALTSSGNIDHSYARVKVSATGDNAGGFVGSQHYYTLINNSYATGNVTGDSYVGGFVGSFSGTVTNSYSTGKVSGAIYVGGFRGLGYSGFSGCYWDGDTSGQADSYGGSLATTAQMKTLSTFRGWNIGSANVNFNNGYPYLSWEKGSSSYDWLIYVYSSFQLSGCANITSAGVYSLLSDISATETCFNISTDNVMLDLNGFTITGDNSGEDYGVYTSGVKNISVKNGKIELFGKNTANGYGIYFEGVNNSEIKNLNVTNSYYGLVFSSSQNNSLVNVGAYNNSNIQIYSSNWATSSGNVMSYINSFGEIKFKAIESNINGSIKLGVGNSILIANNSAYENSSAISGLNVSANITLNNLHTNIINPKIMKDGVACTDCYNFSSLNAGTVKFNVSSWSNYNITGDGFSSVGTGTLADPYQISTWTQLNSTGNNITAYYILMVNLSSSDADYSGFGNNWTPIGVYPTGFKGGFNGNNNTISDLVVKPKIQFGGLFGLLKGNISDIGLINVSIVNGRSYSGGLVGYSDGIITNSYSKGKINGTSYIGGLVGIANKSITNSYSEVNVSGTGLGTGNYVGGLAGMSEITGTITGCHASGNVSGDLSYVGGLVGDAKSGIIDSYASGNVIASGIDVGGLVGGASNAVTNSYASGNVIGGGYIGGLAGELTGVSSGLITNSSASGNVSGGSADDGLGGFVGNVGGLVGKATSGISITTSYASGNVNNSGDYSGGLAGYSAVKILQSYSAGTTIGSGDYVGGLVGEVGGIVINNTYAIGNVSGSSDSVGGLIGYSAGTVTNSYSTGNVSGSTSVGGLVGWNVGAVTNSYWNNQTSGQATSDGGIGKTTSQMKSYTTFSSWDKAPGSNTLNNGYPYLSSGVTSIWLIAYLGSLTNCAELDGANVVYSLQNNIPSASANCFNITAENVTLDLNGYTVTGPGVTAGASYGVKVNGHNNALIENGTFTNFIGNSVNAAAVYLNNSNNSLVKNINGSANSYAIKIDSGFFNNVTNSIVESSSQIGIYIGGTSNQIINLTARNNSLGIMLAGQTNYISEAIITRGYSGLNISGSNSIFNNSNITQTGFGINLGNSVNATVINLNCWNNSVNIDSRSANPVNPNLIYTNSLGTIRWLNKVTLFNSSSNSNITFNSANLNIIITNGSAFVNTTKIPELNISANISFDSITRTGYSARYYGILMDNLTCSSYCTNLSRLNSSNINLSVANFGAGTISIGKVIRDSFNVSLTKGWNMISLKLEGNQTGDKNITLVEGNNLIGISTENSVAHSGIEFTTSSGNEMTLSQAANSGYVQKYFAYWDVVSVATGTKNYKYAGKDDTNLVAGKAYWVKVNDGGGNLTIPDAGGNALGESYPLSELMFRNDTSGELFNLTYAVEVKKWWGKNCPGVLCDAKVNYWNDDAFKRILYSDLSSLNSWQGYFINMNVDGVSLVRQN